MYGILRSSLLLLFTPLIVSGANGVNFSAGGYTSYGTWSSDISYSPAAWKPGDTVTVDATLQVSPQHLRNLSAAGIPADSFCMLVTAERTFDPWGHLRLPSDQYMSTLVTPTGLPIEGGAQGASTTRFGGAFRTPLDALVRVPVSALSVMPSDKRAMLHMSAQLPKDLPPGLYRMRIDFGVMRGTSYYSLNGDGFAAMPFFRGQQPQSYVYSPLIAADGTAATGEKITATAIKARVPWVLLNNYNSNGYKGVVADEDSPYFAVSPRNLIQDDVILPRFDNSNKPLTYSLEPQFLADTIDGCWNIPWDLASGEYAVEVTGPDGVAVSLGKYPFVGANGQWPTTRRTAITAWKPPAYGLYKVKASGYILDIYGNRYEGGGTYRFWIGKRMTLATATFQGMPYPVGSIYGRDTAFSPAVPADVSVTATLYPNSDPALAQTVTWSGKANAAGVYGALQGAKNLPLSAPGEYCARVTATYTDKDGHLWVCSMRHAGVVYDPNGPIVARGKKLAVNGQYLERGETKTEGYIDTSNGNEVLQHLNFPYNASDVLLLASDGQGANKIIPTMTYEFKKDAQRNDAGLNGIGVSNLQLQTSNGYSPHMFPEYITDWAYYYGSAARPGFVARFVVGETYIRAPYWSVSPNSFGGQINASSNGDMPGDIYRLMGGVVLRQKGAAPAYAGYISSGFLLPQGEKNNRVIAPGSEDLTASTGQKGRVFLVGPRPGMTYLVGASFGAALQIDPIVPVNITFKMRYPDGRVLQTSGVSDQYGSFSAKDKFTLDVPGIYTYSIDADWNGHPAVMPGLPATGGNLFVLEANPPAGATGLQLTVQDAATFDAVAGTHVTGTSTAEVVHYTVVMPGAVLDEGDLPVVNGKFDYFLNPAELHGRATTYDVTNRVTGRPELGDVLHISLFAKERTGEGQDYHSFVRVIVRGNQIRVAR